MTDQCVCDFRVIQNIADGRPKVRYLVAVDDSKNPLEEVVKAVSSALSTGKVRAINSNMGLWGTSNKIAVKTHLTHLNIQYSILIY